MKHLSLLLVCFFFASVSPYTAAHEDHAPESDGEFHVYILKTMDLSLINDTQIAFQRDLQALLPSYTLHFVVDNANGDLAQAKTLISERLNDVQAYDLFVSVATVATKAMVATADLHKIPMQFLVVSEPVEAGVVSKIDGYSEIGMTGISHVIAAETKLRLMQQIIENSKIKKNLKIGLLYSDYPSSSLGAQRLMEVQDKYQDITLVPIKYDIAKGEGSAKLNRERVVQALSSHKDTIDGYWIPPGPAAHDNDLYRDIQQKLQIPQLFSEDMHTVKMGALFGVFGDANTIARSGAGLAKKLLLGAPANSLAVSRSRVFIVAVNTTTAINLGLVFPSSLLSLADQHIYR